MTKENGEPQAYGVETYWDNRYSQDTSTFDWYQRYAGVAPLINMYIPKSSKILMVGCGNAGMSLHISVFFFDECLRYTGRKGLGVLCRNNGTEIQEIFGWGIFVAISEDMVFDGYQDIVNIDISAVVIEAMREKYKDMHQLQCNPSSYPDFHCDISDFLPQLLLCMKELSNF